MATRHLPLDKQALFLLRRVLNHPRLASTKVYLVGGYLRDSILGRPLKDLDLAVKVPVVEAAQDLADDLGGKLVVLGRTGQTARIILSHGAPARNLIQLDFTPIETTIEEDLRARDFTIDAMAVHLEGSKLDQPLEILDPVGGLADLHSRSIRRVSEDSFRNDPARLIRAVRLASELGFSIDPDTQSLMARDGELINLVAPERVKSEMCCILAVRDSYQWLRLMERVGLLKRLFPELEEGRGVLQPKEHFWDVYHHNLQTFLAVEQLVADTPSTQDEFLASVDWVREVAGHFQQDLAVGVPRGAMVKLAGLFHDIAKPRARMVDASGRIRFFGHHLLGAQMANEILRRWRFSRDEAELVQMVVRYHLRPGQMSQDGKMPTPRAVYRLFRDAGEYAIDTVVVNLADYRAARGPLMKWQEWKGYSEICRHIVATGLTKAEEKRLSPLVDGYDLMNEFKLSPGPAIGQLLERINEARAAGEIASKAEALEFATRIIGIVPFGARR